MGRLVAAPLAAQILADLGADVVKIEHPQGDEYRHYGPSFLGGDAENPTGLSSGFIANNRGKRSIALDLTTENGAGAARRLAGRADVFIENFKTGGLEKFGLDRDSLLNARPELIYVSVTGFGQAGPYAMRPATDGVIQAMSGLQSLTGDPEGPPQRLGGLVVDTMTGIYSALAVMAALRHREVNGGAGQHIDMALLDCAMAAVGTSAIEYRLSGVAPRRYGNGQPGAVPAQAYECQDGYVQIQAAFDSHFVRLCGAFGLTIATDTRFADRRSRVSHESQLAAILIPEFGRRTVAEVMGLLNAAEVICSPINDIAAALEDPQVVYREIEFGLDCPDAGFAPMVASPMRFSETPVQYVRNPPRIGEHSAEVLRDWLGAAEL